METEEMLRYLLGKLSHQELVEQLVGAFEEFHPTEDEQDEALRDLMRYFYAREVLLEEYSIEDVPEEDRDYVQERIDSILKTTMEELQV